MTWIKCSEQVPPCGWHLAYSPLHGIMLSRHRLLVTDAFGHHMECTESGIEITHWMPMPEPPGAEKPRKVKLPQRWTEASCDGYEMYLTEMEGGEWVKTDDVIAALKAAGVEVVE